MIYEPSAYEARLDLQTKRIKKNLCPVCGYRVVTGTTIMIRCLNVQCDFSITDGKWIPSKGYCVALTTEKKND